MNTGNPSIWTYSERSSVALELLAPGRALAARTGARLTSVLMGKAAAGMARQFIGHGADEALVWPGAAFDGMRPEQGAAVLGRWMGERRPLVLLVGGTHNGVELAARLAQRLGLGCASGCLALELAEDGSLQIERGWLGRFVARQALGGGSPAVVIVPPRRFAAPEFDERREGPAIELLAEAPEPRVRVTGSRPRPKSASPIDRARVVVSIGRGLKRKEDLPLIQSFAEALGGVVGSSRPLADHLQWLPVDVKVGLSGQTVRPELYVACGISGQIEHIVGMRESKVVVAINRDAGAPIFQEADYQVVGDLYEILPALEKAVAALRR